MPYKTLITGATGFLGAPLAAFLIEKGHRVVAFSDTFETPAWLRLPQEIQEEVQCIEGDIRDSTAVKAVVKDCLHAFHMAALMPNDTWSSHAYIETNVTGTLNLLHAALPGDCKVIHLSDGQVYGPGLYSPIDETHPLLGQSPYASSKIASDMLAESFVRSFGLAVNILRPFHIYGPGQNKAALVPQLLEALENQLPIPDPYTCRDLLYITDFLSACEAALHKGFKGHLFNIGSGKITSNQEVGEALAKQLKKKFNPNQDQFQAPKKIFPSMPASILHAQTELNWAPCIDLDSGIQALLES